MSILDLLITIGWVAFWLYWLVAAIGSKKNSVPRVQHIVVARLIMFALIVLLIRTSLTKTVSLNHALFVQSNKWLLSIGFILFIAGLLLAIWARLYLGDNWGMPMSLKQDPELVTTGPYRFIRHPIYTGILIAMLGSALASSTYWLVILVIMAIYFIYSAIAEEKIMQRQFPKAYANYKKQTKMLIPFVL
jgi:protein-S-isoprenylcysteine O-methyltransferase Ste14